jgi:hypothetical protein
MEEIKAVWDLITDILPALLVAYITRRYTKKQEKRDKATEEAETKRKLNERIQVTLLVATAKLTYAAAMSIKRGTAVDELDEKIADYTKAIKDFRDFERNLVADTRSD